MLSKITIFVYNNIVIHTMIRKFFELIKTSIIYCFYSIKYRSTDFFHYKQLANPNFVSPAGFSSVLLYGNWKAIASLKHSRFNFFTEYLEHGMCFYNSPDTAEYLGYINRKGIKKIYTYGARRKKILEEYLSKKQLTDREVIAIGPYILGAKHFFSEKKLTELKEKYGKILLVFPSHSFDNYKVNYGVSELIQEIENIKSNFDTVFMCIYWKDIINNPEDAILYKDKGYVVVCCGNRSDAKFLSRQKDIISLSDMVMTNDVGSQIGYAICMNKPVYFFTQNIQSTQTKFDEYDNGKISTYHKCKELFSTFSFNINDAQKDFIEELWGKW